MVVSKRGIIVWVSIFVTFMSIMVSLAMLDLLVNHGADYVVNPYILGSIFGALSVEAYFWIFITTTFIFLGITCIIIYRRQPPDPELVKLLLKVGGNLAALKKSQEGSTAQITEQMEYNRKVNQKFFSTVSDDLKQNSQETLDGLTAQKRAIKKVGSDMVSVLEQKTTESGEKIAADLKRQEAAVLGVKRLSEEGSRGILRRIRLC